MKRLFCLLALCTCLPLCAQNAKTERERLNEEIARLDRQIAANSSKSADAQAKLKLTQKKVSAQRSVVKAADAEVASLDAKISTLKKEITLSERELDTALTHYRRLIRTAYLNRDPRIWFMYILTGENLSQVLNRYSYLRSASTTLHSRAESIIADRERLEVRRRELESLRASSVKLRDKRNKEYKALKATESKEKAIIADLKKNTAKCKAEIAAKQKRAAELDRKVQGMVGKKVTSAADKKLSGAFASNKGKLPWPVDGVVIEHFGEHPHPVMKTVKVKCKGVNIAVEANAPVYCIFEGTVANVVIMPGYNQCVLVQHGEYYSFYCGVKDCRVKAGDKLSGGQQIGKVETIDSETVLHFQIWYSSTVQNPEKWLR